MFKKVLILLSISIFFSCSLFDKDEVRDFNKESWVNSPSERYEMADDLLDNHLFVGMSKNEVISLLGDTYYEYQTKFEYNMGSSGYDWVYLLYIEFETESVINFYKEKAFL